MGYASFTFTDSIGTATLANWAPAVGTMLCGYVPDQEPVGQSRVLVANGATRFWSYRDDDHTAAFEIRLLPRSVLPIANRLKAHLIKGGTVAIDTGDGVNTYPTLGIAPGSTPEIRLADPKLRRYTLAFRVANRAASPVMIEVAY